MDGGLIAMRMRLSGGKEVAAEAETATAAVEETTAATDAANKKVARSSGAIGSSLRKQITGMRTIGRALTKYITVPLAALAIGSAVMAAHFDRSMNLVATDAGGSVKEVAKLKGEVLDLARHSQFGPQKLADSLFHVESSGYRGAKAIRVLNEAQKLATAGYTDLESTTYALVSAQKALSNGDSLAGITKTAAQLNEIVSHGDIRLEELTSAMSTGLLPTAKALGLSVADVGSALDVMTKRGIPAQRSAYALNFTLQKLVPSTEKAEKAFGKLGLGQEELLKTAQKKGLPTALKLLRDSMSGMTKGRQIQTIDEMFGGGRMSKGLLVAIQHVGEMQELWHLVDGNVALYKKHVREAENQPLVKAQRAWSSIEAGLIEIGQVLLPAAIPLMEHFASILAGAAHGFAALPHSTQHTIVLVGVLAATLGPILLMVAKLLEMWKTISELSLLQGIGGGLGELGAAASLARGGELGGFGMMGAKGTMVGAAALGIGSQVVGHEVGGKGGSLISNVGTGAAIGGAVGSVVPGVGTLLGGAVGATAGAVATALPAWKELLGITHKMGPLQARVAASSDELTTALKNQHKAGAGLTAATERLRRVQHHHHEAITEVKRAQGHLNAVVAEYGPHSRQAIHAEAQLAGKMHERLRLTNKLANADRMKGTALSAYKTETDQTILAERHRINTMKALYERQSALFLAAKAANPVSERTKELAHNLLGTEGKLSEAIKAHAGTLQEAATKAGPKYAHFLQHASQETLRWGSAFKATMAEARRFQTGMEGLSERLGQLQFGPKAEPSFGGNNFGVPRPHHHAPEHKGASAGLETKGSQTLERLLNGEGGVRVRTVHHQPLTIKANGRALAETVVEIQEDEDARA